MDDPSRVKFSEENDFKWVNNSPAQISDAVEEILLGVENLRGPRGRFRISMSEHESCFRARI